MSIVEALMAPQCTPFTVALAVMVAIALIEGAGAIVGLSMNAALSQLFDIDAPDADIDGDATPGALSKTLSWLRIGRVPVLIAAIVALTLFGLGGITAQAVMTAVIGTPINAWIAAPVVAIAILPMVRAINAGMARIMPRDETEVVSRASFRGRTGTVTLGPVTATQMGQCRIRDRYGQLHHIAIIADTQNESFEIGTSVLLVEEAGSRWRVIGAQDIAQREKAR